MLTVKKNRIDLNLFMLVVLTPSLTYFSSIFLRESLILVLMIWSTYFILEKKYHYIVIPSIILILIKLQNFFILLLFFYLNFIFSMKKNLVFIFLNIIVVFVVLYFYGDTLLYEFNLKRKGMYSENFGNYKGITSLVTYKDLSLNFSISLGNTNLKSAAQANSPSTIPFAENDAIPLLNSINFVSI